MSGELTIKVGMVGEAQVGKTSLMYRYVKNSFDQDYIQTLGVNFMQKSVTLKTKVLNFSIWDLGGEDEFRAMLPLVVEEAAVVLFMFDLTRIHTLQEIKTWYSQVRKINPRIIPFLVGTKFDCFASFPKDKMTEITNKAFHYSEKMKCPLFFTSARSSINISKIFKVIIAKLFKLKPAIEKVTTVGLPIVKFGRLQ
eukprot:gnl/Carplike_NY0171/6517_a8953_219.p1 GENE.gnl/Carplike_NY0171/6517_a8953_219~~gnl/Carplike_NY0171/6517_a8953_219.p1  ORF type:complete len:203 (-),score=19.26 gnl/Carplike_NY0171/6517_a8953_219:85-672(-)